MRHFLGIEDCGSDELRGLLALSAELKKLYKSGGRDPCLAGRTLVMLFEKPSLRTRISFEVAMNDLGGYAIYVRPEDIGGIGVREPVKDMARVVSRYNDAILARTFRHSTVAELAAYSNVPVINALTDRCHPCQAMADVLTIGEHFGELKGVKIAFIGDGNNVARSLALACAKLGMTMAIASPAGYRLDAESLAAANSISPGSVAQARDPASAVENADVIYTDTWVSMGQEDQKNKRRKDFDGFQVNAALIAAAPKNARIMHCLPANRDFEITDGAVESPNSIIFDQSENRLHFQRALLKNLLA
jgi:ornithine carbamoyltransferase